MRWWMLVAVVGCGSTPPEPLATELEGIYKMTSLTRNETGCDVEGPDVIDSWPEDHIAIAPDEIDGQAVLEIIDCYSPIDCRELAMNPYVVASGFGYLTDGTDATGWSGDSAFAIARVGPACGSKADHTTLVVGDGTITVRNVGTEVEYVGSCDLEGVLAAARGEPCTSLIVTNATFVEPLPPTVQ